MGTPRLKSLVDRLKEALSGEDETIPDGWMSLKDLQQQFGLGTRQTRTIAWTGVEKGVLEHKFFRLTCKSGGKKNFSYFKEIIG